MDSNNEVVHHNRASEEEEEKVYYTVANALLLGRELDLAADQLESGVVKRQIECGWKTDPFNRTIRRLIRLDTNETVEVDEIKGENLFGGQTTAQET